MNVFSGVYLEAGKINKEESDTNQSTCNKSSLPSVRRPKNKPTSFFIILKSKRLLYMVM